MKWTLKIIIIIIIITIIIIIIVVIIIVIIYVSIIIVIIILALSIHLFYPSFNVIVVSVLPAFIVVVKPCTTCTLNDLVPCSIGIKPYTNLKTKFVQRNLLNW